MEAIDLEESDKKPEISKKGKIEIDSMISEAQLALPVSACAKKIAPVINGLTIETSPRATQHFV